MDTPHRNKIRDAMGFVFVLLLTALLVFLYYHYFKNDTSDTDVSGQTIGDNSNVVGNANFDSKDQSAVATSQPNNTDNSTTNSNNGPGTADTTAPAAGTSQTTDPYVYYNQGLADANNKNYQSAIDNFDKAIAVNPKVPDFYSKKSEAEVFLGDKSSAIATVQAGLAANPGDTTLLSKLDILQTVVK